MNENQIRAEARRDAFNEAASVDAQVIAMLLAAGKVRQDDVDEALLNVQAMRSQQTPTAVVPVKAPGAPRLLDKLEIAILMQSDGLVMTAPYNGARMAELIKIGDDAVQYSIPAIFYEQAVRQIVMLGVISPFVNVAIKEPGCDAVWAVVAASNKTALQFRCDPALVPREPDDTDEGDD